MIVERLAEIRQQIRLAAEAAGRDPASVRLLAVSKTVGADAIRQAYDAGQRDVAENRVPELAAKAEVLPADLTWHLIGHLQSNKARLALRHAAWVHSVDSAALLERLEAIAAADQRQPVVLLQINLSGEATKSGVGAEAAPALLRTALACPHLRCRGLMTMAPYAAPEDTLRAVFGGLRRLRDRLQDDTGEALPELSMGMSGDFRTAIAEGATVVRIGTALFGPREIDGNASISRGTSDRPSLAGNGH